MIKTDDYDLAFSPLRIEGISKVAMKEFAAELPCACQVTEEGKLCESCFARMQVLELG